eukprot:COSAG05_NODE_22289_length_266_cov_0.514970_1_plen_55_part_01
MRDGWRGGRGGCGEAETRLRGWLVGWRCGCARRLRVQRAAALDGWYGRASAVAAL